MTIQWTDDMNATVLTMQGEGHPMVDIAVRVGVCHETLRKRFGPETQPVAHLEAGQRWRGQDGVDIRTVLEVIPGYPASASKRARGPNVRFVTRSGRTLQLSCVAMSKWIRTTKAKLVGDDH